MRDLINVLGTGLSLRDAIGWLFIGFLFRNSNRVHKLIILSLKDNETIISDSSFSFYYSLFYSIGLTSNLYFIFAQ